MLFLYILIYLLTLATSMPTNNTYPTPTTLADMTNTASKLCGTLFPRLEERDHHISTHVFGYCFNTPWNMPWIEVANYYCKKCYVWKDYGCNGEVTWIGQSNRYFTYTIAESRSYQCWN